VNPQHPLPDTLGSTESAASTAAAADGWSMPSIFGRALLAEPREHLAADPMAELAELPELPELSDLGGQWGSDWSVPVTHEPVWGSTTFVGPSRYLPDATVAPPKPARHVAQTDKGVLASSRTMAIASLTSRVTGFIRSAALLAALGTGAVGDAYNGANNFPNSVYELLLGGVLSSVLIPLLVHASEHDEDAGEAYTQRLLSIATAVLAVATLVAVALAPYIADAFVPHGGERTLTSIFATLLLPEIFFYGLGAMFTAVLNTRHVYGPGAWAPVVNNVITLVTVAIFLALPGPKTLVPTTMTTAQVLVIGIGTTLGIVGQALILLPSMRRVGFRWVWRFRARPNEAGRLKEASALSGWLLGYVAASQIGVLTITKVAISFGVKYHHGVTTFAAADLLFQVPFGILGVSLLTAIMPRMARNASRGDNAAVLDDVRLGARLSALALVPITAGLIVLAPAFTVAIYAHGETTIASAHLIGSSLAWSAFGLLPFAFVMLQLRVFYAMRDGRTPTLINIFMVATKVALVLIAAATLHGNVAVEALNFSTSVSYLVGAVIGHVLLRRRMGPLGFRSVAMTVARVAAASAAGGLAAFGVLEICTGLLGNARGGSLVAVLVGSIIGLAVMGVIAWLLGIDEAHQIVDRLRQRRRGGVEPPADADPPESVPS
jgi:putative peptidoglycan lipid II flippase